ncbi:MAG: hypothetical protein HKN87_02075 [Saprospiraceae bacterium]|nr:hypothetical protein [Saprospiraceae bacterium]
MTQKFASTLDTKILKDYAVTSTGLFLLLLLYAACKTPIESWLSPMSIVQLQSMGSLCLLMVLTSSILGMGFHHLVSSSIRARNTFAFVFTCTLLKFLGTLAFFSMII